MATPLERHLSFSHQPNFCGSLLTSVKQIFLNRTTNMKSNIILDCLPAVADDFGKESVAIESLLAASFLTVPFDETGLVSTFW